MSATTTTTPFDSGASTTNETGTTVKLSKEEALRKRAAKREAEREANIAMQKTKSDLAKKKYEEELRSKGKNAILKSTPSRPVRRPAKKNRTPLSPPSNREHNTRTATPRTKAAIESDELTSSYKEQLAALSIVRPNLNFEDIIEQRVVNGVVERITQPTMSLPIIAQSKSMKKDSLLIYSHQEVIEKCVVHSATDIPEAAASNNDSEADPADDPDKDTDGDIPRLVHEFCTPEQETDSSENSIDFIDAASTSTLSNVDDKVPMTDAQDEASLPDSLNETVENVPKHSNEIVSGVSPCRPSTILSTPNAALYPSRLSREQEASLTAIHVTPCVLPVNTFNQQKLTKAEKKAAKAAEVSQDVNTVEFEVPQKQPELDSVETTTSVAGTINTTGNGYVATLLMMPNGPGVTKESGGLHEKLVAMHITPLSMPDNSPKPQKASKAERKAAKADQKTSVADERNEPDFIASLLSGPNGPGKITEALDIHENLVETYVAPLKLPHFPQQQERTEKIKNPVDHTVSGPVPEPGTMDTSVVDKDSVIAGNHTSAINVDDFTQDEDTLVGNVPELGPLTYIDAKDDLQQVNVQVEDANNKQTVIIPDDTTPITPPLSDPDLSSAGSSMPKSSKASRRSSVKCSEETVRRKAEKARTTFLGNISLETFINTLDFELCDGTTTKEDICDAFASLAGQTTANVNTVKVQRKIKLGGTSLYSFLRQLDFDDDELTVVGQVMRVFNKAAGNTTASSKLEVALYLAESSQDEDSQRAWRSQRASLFSGSGRLGL